MYKKKRVFEGEEESRFHAAKENFSEKGGAEGQKVFE